MLEFIRFGWVVRALSYRRSPADSTGPTTQSPRANWRFDSWIQGLFSERSQICTILERRTSAGSGFPQKLRKFSCSPQICTTDRFGQDALSNKQDITPIMVRRFLAQTMLRAVSGVEKFITREISKPVPWSLDSDHVGHSRARGGMPSVRRQVRVVS